MMRYTDMDIHLGEFVYATKGRDSGKCFIVITAKDNYLYLCDGKSRKVSNPKKKKIKHVLLKRAHATQIDLCLCIFHIHKEIEAKYRRPSNIPL